MSQILLNDASERGQKIKVVATLRNGLSAKEFANFIASERHEKVRGRPSINYRISSYKAFPRIIPALGQYTKTFFFTFCNVKAIVKLPQSTH